MNPPTTAAPKCIDCGDDLTGCTTAFSTDPETGYLRWTDTGAPCGHVQLDTIVNPTDPSIGQIMAEQAAETIRLTAPLLADAPGAVHAALHALADLVEQYDGLEHCPLCGPGEHAATCPLRTRTEEWTDQGQAAE